MAPRANSRLSVLAAIAAASALCLTLAALPAEARMPPRAEEQPLLGEDPEVLAFAYAYFPATEADAGKGDRAPAGRVFRLTRDQIDATAAVLLSGLALPSIKATMAKDPRQTNYEYAELLRFNAANFGALWGWIGKVAALVRDDPARLIKCPAAKPDDKCLDVQARAFMAKAFRGDGDAERINKAVEFYRAGVTANGFAQATGDLVSVVLASPDFLFRKEVSVAGEVKDGGRLLVPAQRLQALTYTFADAPPEALGLDAAKAAAYFASPDELRRTAAVVLASKPAREKLVRFFKAWLEVRDKGEFMISSKLFPEFDETLEAAMLEETDTFLRTRLAPKSPTLKALTLATETSISAPLAPIYGVRMASGAAQQTVKLDPKQRLGVFSLPAVIASHSGPTDTRLIKRGVLWVRKAMCMELGTVPPGLDISLIEPKQTMTERQRVEASTRPPACAGCHKAIDPFGFALENYDPIGRWRTTDNGLPIDASIAVDFLDQDPKKPSDEPVKAAGPVEAIRLFAGSMMFKQCVVRQMFRYYMGRSEQPSDHAALRRMFFAFARKDEQAILKPLELLAVSDIVTAREADAAASGPASAASHPQR